MDNNFNEKVNEAFGKLVGVLNTKTIVGEAIVLGEATIIPLIEMSCAMGIGDFSPNNAGGLATKLTPVACVIVQNGITKIVNIKNNDPLSKLIELFPDLINDVLGKEKITKEIKKVRGQVDRKYYDIDKNND